MIELKKLDIFAQRLRVVRNEHISKYADRGFWISDFEPTRGQRIGRSQPEKQNAVKDDQPYRPAMRSRKYRLPDGIS